MENVSARQVSVGAAARSTVSGHAFGTPRLFTCETKFLNLRSSNGVNINYMENHSFLRGGTFCAKLNCS